MALNLQEQQLLPLLMGLEMPMVYVLAAMEHHGIAFSSKALSDQLPAMDERLQQLMQQAAKHIKRGDLEKVRRFFNIVEKGINYAADHVVRWFLRIFACPTMRRSAGSAVLP
jgi:hypothetical protein